MFTDNPKARRASIWFALIFTILFVIGVPTIIGMWLF